MQEHHSRLDDWGAAFAKVAVYVLAWFGSWTLAEVQQLAGIVSAFAVAIVAMLNGYLIWRDRNKPRRKTRRSAPPTPPPAGDPN